jgi:DNA-binding NarL/FixJ family response regulator
LNPRSFERSTESDSPESVDDVHGISHRSRGATEPRGVPRPSVRLLVADADGLMRAGVRSALKESQFTVVGEADTGSKLLPAVRQTAPDVVLLNPEMPELDGLMCLERLTARHPEVIVVMLATSATPAQMHAAFVRGAQGWIMKTIGAEELGPAIAETLAATVFHLYGPVVESGVEANAAGLSSRELEILRLVGRGCSNKQIATELWITVQTVKFHLTNVYRKLELPNRTAAARWAHESGLLARGSDSRPRGETHDGATWPPPSSSDVDDATLPSPTEWTTKRRQAGSRSIGPIARPVPIRSAPDDRGSKRPGEDGQRRARGR